MKVPLTPVPTMHATPAEIAHKALADHLAAHPSAELLKRYAARRDPEAFAGLVQQFGPMVFGVCRRVLGQAADADDAFQAVFLSLARQADSLRDATALPAWLHRVALRVAHKALARRAGASAPVEAVPDPADPFAEVAWKDVRRALDEELDALPDKYRGPVVLCWLDGLTQDEAARRLGTSLATLKRRLDAGRELLRARLVRRGLAPVLAAGAVLDATGLSATVPDALKALAVELGVPEAAIPPAVEALGVAVAVTASGRSFLKVALALVLVGGIATAGALGVGAFRPTEPLKPEEPPPLLVQFDGPEEPLPAWAVARFGTAKFRVPGEILGWASPARNENPSWAKPTALSRDGRLMAVSAFGSISVYETTTWKLVHRTVGTTETRLAAGPVFLSPNGEFVTYREYMHPGELRGNRKERERWAKGSLYLLDARTGLSRKFVEDGTGLLGFTADGLFMHAGVGCIDPVSGNVVRPLPTGVWDGNSARPGVTVARVKYSPDIVEPPRGLAPPINRGVAPSPDGKLVAEVTHHGHDGATVKVWRAGPWELIGVFRSHEKYPLREWGEGGGVSGQTPTAAAYIAEDNQSIALIMPNGDLARWDLKTGRGLPRLRTGALGAGDSLVPHWVCGYHVLPGGLHVLTPCSDGTIRIWDSQTGSELPIPGRYDLALSVCASGDSRFIAVADFVGRVDLLDATTGRVIRQILKPNGTPVNGLALNHDGSTVAVHQHPDLSGEPMWLAGGGVRFLDATSGKPVPERAFPHAHVPHRDAGKVTSDMRVRVEPVERRLWFHGENGRVLAWFDLDSRELYPDEQEKRHIMNAIISPNGKRVFVTFEASEREPVARGIWDVESGRLLAPLNQPEARGVAFFTADGKSLITFDVHTVNQPISINGRPNSKLGYRGSGVGYRWDVEKLITAQKK